MATRNAGSQGRRQLLEFMTRHGVLSVATTDGISRGSPTKKWRRIGLTLTEPNLSAANFGAATAPRACHHQESSHAITVAAAVPSIIFHRWSVAGTSAKLAALRRNDVLFLRNVGVTRYPTAEWATQQIVECCAWDRWPPR
jgi:hypothetical protein